MSPFGPWPGLESAGEWPGPNQNLATQAAWFIVPTATAAFPVAGSDNNDGKTAATALQTMTELGRRTWGMGLTTLSPTVTIASSLLAGDDVFPVVMSNVGASRFMNYVGSPTDIMAATPLTADVVVNRVGATGTRTSMTCNAIPVSWTASGLLGHVIEGATSGALAIVVRDVGAKTARLSLPINNAAGTETTFIVGESVSVWQLPNIRTPRCLGGFNLFTYLDATFWQSEWGANLFKNCTGQVRQWAGINTMLNCASGRAPNQNIVVNGQLQIQGGFHSLNLSGPAWVNVKVATTTDRILLEGQGRLSTSGVSGGAFADVEVDNQQADPNPWLNPDNLQGGDANFGGFVYGDSASTTLVQCTGESARVQFDKQPAVTGAPNILLQGAITELAARLAIVNLYDKLGNNIVGPAGPYVDKTAATRALRGIIAETFDLLCNGANTVITDGTVNLSGIYLRAGDVIANVTVAITTAGTLMTRSRIGLYDVNGNLLAQTADQGASWQTTGTKIIALAFTVLTSGWYYIGLIAKGTTVPAIARGVIPNNTQGLTMCVALNGGVLPYGSMAGQADLPNPVTVAAGATPGQLWHAVF